MDGGITVPGFTEGGRLDVKKSHIYLGGAPPHSPYLPPEATLYKTPFRGCIHSLQIWNNKVRKLYILTSSIFVFRSKMLGLVPQDLVVKLILQVKSMFMMWSISTVWNNVNDHGRNEGHQRSAKYV